jgi:methionyl aminopeptidase
MRRAGAVVADVLSQLQKLAEPGVTTAALDRTALEMTADAGAEALFKGVRNPQARMPFPGAICASINEQVVHGIPSERAVLREGDLLSVDFGVKLNGYCGDSAVTMAIGEVSPEKRTLVDTTREVLEIAIAMCRPRVRWSEVAGRMQAHAEAVGLSVVRDFVGHGIGTQMHEDPKVPNFVSEELLAEDIVLAEGMVLAVEPMINAGTHAVRTLADQWVIVTRDGKCSAHFEHTIAIVNGGCEVLTKRRDEDG